MVGFENLNAARLSAAGEGWTEPLNDSIDSPRLHKRLNIVCKYAIICIIEVIRCILKTFVPAWR